MAMNKIRDAVMCVEYFISMVGNTALKFPTHTRTLADCQLYINFRILYVFYDFIIFIEFTYLWPCYRAFIMAYAFVTCTLVLQKEDFYWKNSIAAVFRDTRVAHKEEPNTTRSDAVCLITGCQVAWSLYASLRPLLFGKLFALDLALWDVCLLNCCLGQGWKGMGYLKRQRWIKAR